MNHETLLQIFVVLLLTACASAPEVGNLVDVSVQDRNTGEQLKRYRHSYTNLVARGVMNVRQVYEPNPFPGRFVPALVS